MPESHGSAPEGRAASALFAALVGLSVTVWPTAPVLRQVTVVPFGIVSVLGSNLSALVMFTVEATALATATPEVVPVVRVVAGSDVRARDGSDGAQAIYHRWLAGCAGSLRSLLQTLIEKAGLAFPRLSYPWASYWY